MPSVVPSTCNHCDMTVNGTHYVSIVDALDPNNQYYMPNLAAAFSAGLMDGAGGPCTAPNCSGAYTTMRMDGRAFTGFGPASFDPVTRTMSLRMAGCSALVAIDGPGAGKIGTLCMNATATFNVSGAVMSSSDSNGYTPISQISANGSSNCVTVMQPMQQQ